jgi:hypothetical protein
MFQGISALTLTLTWSWSLSATATSAPDGGPVVSAPPKR